MIINLQEIPPEGKSFICNQNTKDLNDSLKDLIGNTPHSAEFLIRPTSPGTFELVGKVQTKLPEQCSRCGIDFDFGINQSFNEILMPSLQQPRGSKYQKANHFTDLAQNVPSVSEYHGHHFNMGEFIHEVVALAEPSYPCPAETEKGDCSLCLKPVRGEPFSYEDKGFEEETQKNPFSVLKGIKLN